MSEKIAKRVAISCPILSPGACCDCAQRIGDVVGRALCMLLSSANALIEQRGHHRAKRRAYAIDPVDRKRSRTAKQRWPERARRVHGATRNRATDQHIE